MKIIIYLILTSLILNSCSQVRKSAGVNRKSIDEFQVVENPPLVIPPDFNILPPDQLEEKRIDEIEKELAQEILFGLDEEELKTNKQLSTMNKILTETNASEVNSNIREEIDEEYAKEINTGKIFKKNWGDEVEVLDAVKESECIRNKNFEGESIADCKSETKLETIEKTKKKKKRFFFF